MSEKINETLILGKPGTGNPLEWVTIANNGKLKMGGKENNPDDYIYSANIILDETEYQAMVDTMGKFYAEFAKKPEMYPFDISNPKCFVPAKKTDDGNYSINAKANVWFTTKDGQRVQKKIGLINAKNQPVNNFDKRIANGSIGCLSARMFCWNRCIINGKFTEAKQDRSYGVSLGLDKVQLIVFKEFVQESPFTASSDENAEAFTGGEGFFDGSSEGESNPTRLPQ